MNAAMQTSSIHFPRVGVGVLLVDELRRVLLTLRKPRNCEPHKTSQVHWFPLNDLPPNLTMTAHNALQAVRSCAQPFANTKSPQPEK